MDVNSGTLTWHLVLLCSSMIDSDISDSVIGISISVIYMCISFYMYMCVESFKVQMKGEVAPVHSMKSYGELGLFYLHSVYSFFHIQWILINRNRHIKY